MWDWIKKHWVEVIIVLVVIYVLYYAYETSQANSANAAVNSSNSQLDADLQAAQEQSALSDLLGTSTQAQSSSAANNPIQSTSGPSPVSPPAGTSTNTSTAAPAGTSTNTSTAAPGAADAFVNGQFQLTGPGGPSQADALAANASQQVACSAPGASWPACENTPMVEAIFTQNGIPVPSVTSASSTNVVSTTVAQGDQTATTPSPVLASRPPLRPINLRSTS